MYESTVREFISHEIEAYHSPRGSTADRDQSAADHVRRALTEKGLDVAVPRGLIEKVLAEELAKHDEN